MSGDGGSGDGNGGTGTPYGVDEWDLDPTFNRAQEAPDVDLTEEYTRGEAPPGAYAPPDMPWAEGKPGGRHAYWESRRGEPGAPGADALPWAFYTDPDNLGDLGRGLMNLATPMAFKVASALFSGGMPSPDPDAPPVGSDEPGAGGAGFAYGGGPRMTRVAAAKPKTAGKAATEAASAAVASDQPKRTATGTPSAGIMANVRTTPYGLLGDAPVTRKILMGT